MSKGPDSQTVTQRTEFPPQFTQALDFILGQSMGVANQFAPVQAPGTNFPVVSGNFPVLNTAGLFNPGRFGPAIQTGVTVDQSGNIVPSTPSEPRPILPDVPGQTQQAIEQLSGTDPRLTAAIEAFSSPTDVSGITDFLTGNIERAIADRFSAAGRTGSSNQAFSVGEAVTRQLAPFLFGAQQQDRANLATAAQLGRQPIQDLLMAGELIEGRQREELLEPFTRLNLITDPLIRALGGAPMTTSTTQPVFRNTGGQILGGAIGGLGLGQATGSLAELGSLTPLGAGVFGLGGALLGGLI